MDAITLLKNDHREVERLFKRFERAGDRALATKREIADRVVEGLSRHAAIEEQLFYPVARSTVPDSDDIVLESLEEHHVVKWLLSELDGMDPAEERFDAKMTVLIESVRHHVEEEEQEFFPKVRKELGRAALDDLGEALEAAKKTAPTHPHPRSPDTPPGNVSAATATAMVDRIGDTVSGVAQGSVSVVQDLVAMILGKKRRAPAPTGSSVSRSTAHKVRSGATTLADDAVDGVVGAKRAVATTTSREVQRARRTAAAGAKAAKRTGEEAREGATRTARTARSGVKATAKTARTPRSGAKATAKTARTPVKSRPRKTSASKGAAKKRAAQRS
jgi:hemerythrin-like domain-containing protein